jgi:hypothetical protein
MSKQRAQSKRLAALFCFGVALICQAGSQSGKPPVVAPKVIKLFKPDCSSGNRCYGIHGLVEVTVDVLTDGTVGDVTVKGGDPRLTDEAVRAGKLCRFKPGTLLGKPTSMNYDLKYQFKSLVRPLISLISFAQAHTDRRDNIETLRQPVSFSLSFSSITATPKSLALSNFDPASAPANFFTLLSRTSPTAPPPLSCLGNTSCRRDTKHRDDRV